MRGMIPSIDELLADEPRISAAVERREMRMQDDVRPHLLRPELAHILQEEEAQRGSDPKQVGIPPKDLQNGPTDRLDRPVISRHVAPYVTLSVREFQDLGEIRAMADLSGNKKARLKGLEPPTRC